MRALLLRQFGDPKDLKVEDVPTPHPTGDQVLVEVHSAGINPSDVKNVMGKMHGTTLPRIPGRDFAGVVVEGPAELIGQEVFGTGGDIGFTADGSHAQYILLPRDAITPKPPSLSMDDAGQSGTVFVTAWSAMVTAAGIERGQMALIIGATGGVGSAAVQIAKSRGAKVVAAVRYASDISAARDKGADEAIATESEDLPKAVQELTDGRGVDVAFDGSGVMFAQAIEAAAERGRVPVIASPADGNATFNLRSLYRKRLRVSGIDTRKLDASDCAKLLAQMVPYFESGSYRVPPAQARPLEQAAEAYQIAGSGLSRMFLRPMDVRR